MQDTDLVFDKLGLNTERTTGRKVLITVQIRYVLIFKKVDKRVLISPSFFLSVLRCFLVAY